MSSSFILLVHEDSAVLDQLTAELSAHGYTCRGATTASSAMQIIDARRPDTVLLSLDLADGRAIDLCARIRARTRTPVIVTSAEGGEDRKVATLDAGADDFMVSPVSMPELLARLRVALRHRRELAVALDDTVIHVGTLRIDPDGYAAAVGNRILALTPKEFQLLVILARNAGRVVSHGTLLTSIWPSSKSYDTLRLHVSQLRKKLAQSPGAPVVVTEAGVGYRLRAEPHPDVGDVDEVVAVES